MDVIFTLILHTDLKVMASPHLNLSLSQITHSSVKEVNEPHRIILPWQSDRGMLEIRDAEVDICTHQGCGYGTDTWGWHCILWHGWGKSLVKSLVTMFPMFKWYGIVVICWKFMLGLLACWVCGLILVTVMLEGCASDGFIWWLDLWGTNVSWEHQHVYQVHFNNQASSWPVRS